LKSSNLTFKPPSPYTPFLRRFTDERAADLADTKRLYASVIERFRASVWAAPDIIDRVGSIIANNVAEHVDVPEHLPLCQELDTCVDVLLAQEKALFRTASIHDWSTLTLKDQVDLRRFLRAQEHFLANEDRVVDLLITALSNVTAGLIQLTPSLPATAAFHVPLHTIIDAKDVIERIIGTFSKVEHFDAGIFAVLNDQFYRNICRVSGVAPYTEHTRPLKTAADSDLRGDELIDAYLHGTPFAQLLRTPVPFAIPRSKFVEHTAIFAYSGGGKTVTLQHLILDFLKSDDPPAMFIMDSMGAMLKKIERLKCIPPERLVILDPTDEKPPALNFFKLKGGSPAQRTALFFYLFKAIDQGLTQRQATMVAYLVELMQVIPGATLDTLRQVCESKVFMYGEELDQLDPIARDFFTLQFTNNKDPLINQTKQQIAQRLYTVGRNHTFNLMFNAPDNRFDAFDCMQSGKVVLINTDRLYLGDEASAIFGRYVVAQVLAAGLSRAPIPEAQRSLALLVIDEAKQYLDEQAELILADARQFGLGLILATQAPHQLPEGVQREIATNTSIKMIGGVDYSVASRLARDMQTTPEFIQGMTAHPPTHADFATYVRGVTPQAIKLQVPIGTMEREPQITESEHQALRARNREKYGATRSPLLFSHSAVSHEPIVPPREEVKPQPNRAEEKPRTPPSDDFDPDL
jgi:hypothetical protein